MDDIISLIVIIVEFRFHDLSHDVVIAQRLHLYRTVVKQMAACVDVSC